MHHLPQHIFNSTLRISCFMIGCALIQPVYAGNAVFMLFDDGGEHVVERCEKAALPKHTTKLLLNNLTPANLKALRQKTAFNQHYIGSIQTEFANKNEAGIDAFKHYFKNSASCELTRRVLFDESL